MDPPSNIAPSQLRACDAAAGRRSAGVPGDRHHGGRAACSHRPTTAAERRRQLISTDDRLVSDAVVTSRRRPPSASDRHNRLPACYVRPSCCMLQSINKILILLRLDAGWVVRRDVRSAADTYRVTTTATMQISRLLTRTSPSRQRPRISITVDADCLMLATVFD